MKRASWILLVLFVIVTGIYFLFKYVNENKATEATPSPVASSYLGQETDAILMTLRIIDQNYKVFVMQRNGSGFWDITLPTFGQADIVLASEAETQITNLMIASKIGNVISLADFGLVSPSFSVALTYSNGVSHKLDIGNTSSVGTGYYVQLDDGEVFVVSQYSLDPVLSLIDNPPFPSTSTPMQTTESPEPSITQGVPTVTP